MARGMPLAPFLEDLAPGRAAGVTPDLVPYPELGQGSLVLA
jgi:hypothetical protein